VFIYAIPSLPDPDPKSIYSFSLGSHQQQQYNPSFVFLLFQTKTLFTFTLTQLGFSGTESLPRSHVVYWRSTFVSQTYHLVKFARAVAFGGTTVSSTMAGMYMLSSSSEANDLGIFGIREEDGNRDIGGRIVVHEHGLGLVGRPILTY
jgi:hypothetical protein